MIGMPDCCEEYARSLLTELAAWLMPCAQSKEIFRSSIYSTESEDTKSQRPAIFLNVVAVFCRETHLDGFLD